MVQPDPWERSGFDQRRAWLGHYCCLCPGSLKLPFSDQPELSGSLRGWTTLPWRWSWAGVAPWDGDTAW